MANIQIKHEKITPFWGIFHGESYFLVTWIPVIDKILGQENTPESLSRTFGGCSINLRQTHAVMMG